MADNLTSQDITTICGATVEPTNPDLGQAWAPAIKPSAEKPVATISASSATVVFIDDEPLFLIT